MTKKGQSLMIRCVLALVLMVGFYLLALAIAAGLFYIPYAEWMYAERLHIKLAAICVTSGVLIIWSVLPRFEKFTPPGPELKQDEHPKLFSELTATSEALQEAMPVEVYLDPEVNAWVCNRGGIMGFGSRRVMGLGLPLLKVLNVSELRAVLAHEFGHYHGGETALAPWVYKTREAIMRTLESLSGGILQKPFLWYGKMFLWLTHAVSRQQEYAADALAAQVAGADSLIKGLQKIHGASLAFNAYWKGEVAPVLSAGFRPPIAEGFSRFMGSELVVQKTAAMLKEELETSTHDPYDTHPAMKDRIAALQAAPTANVPIDNAPAMSLLSHETDLEGQLLDALFEEQNRPKLNLITWQETLARVYMPGWTEQARQHVESLIGIHPGDLPELVKQPEKILEKFAAFFQIDTDQEDKVALVNNVIGSALAVVLHDRGVTTTCELAVPVQMSLNGQVISPFSVVADLASAKLSSEEWLSFCSATGIGEMDLGTTIKNLPKQAETVQ